MTKNHQQFNTHGRYTHHLSVILTLIYPHKELHKPVRRKFPRRKVVSNGIDDIWSADLVDMQWASRDNKGVKYLLNVIDVFSKFAWSVPIKDKTGRSITDAFKLIVKASGRKPNKLWVDREFRSWLDDNNIEMYSIYNEGKAVVVERFNRTLKEWMWKYFSANNTRKYLDMLDGLLQLYNTKTHTAIKMTPIEASQSKNEKKVYHYLYPDLPVSVGKAKYKVGDEVRITKKKGKFEKGYTPRWTEEIFEVYMVQNTNPITYLIKDLNGDKIDGSFYEEELQKTSQKVFRIEKILRKNKKNKMVYVKWKGYPDTFNSWIPMKNVEKL